MNTTQRTDTVDITPPIRTNGPTALTRPVSASIEQCELTHVARGAIRLDVARHEHQRYEDALASLGCAVLRLPELPQQPDAVFVEDTVVVLDELAVITRPGAASRRGELRSVASALAPFRTLARIEAPGTLDGGDVLHVGRELYVGDSGRSNAHGIEQLRAHVAPFGYTVTTAPVHDCLHLKSAVTRIGEHRLLINPRWTDAACFKQYDLLEVDPSEPFGANSVVVGDALVYPDHLPQTRRRLEAAGMQVVAVPAGELAKAEGGVSCCSVLLNV
jgi:dimethylargininase